MSKVKIGIIGCGMISEIYARNITQRFGNLELAGCADIVAGAAEYRAAQFGARAMTVDELLADPEIEIVLNLTVPDQHAKVSMAALRAGKCVYSEKPLAIDAAEGRALLDHARANGLLVGAAPDTFLGGGLQTCRRLLDEGAIGKPIGAQGFMLSRGPETFHPNPAFFYQKGAGPVLDWGPYYITALVSLLGPAKRIVGMGKATYPTRTAKSPQCAYQGKPFPVEVPTYVTSILEFADGTLANLTMTFDLQFPYWESRLPYIQLHGTEGTLTVPDVNKYEGPVLLRRGGGEPEEVPVDSNFTQNCRGMGLADMAHALRAGGGHRADGCLAMHVAEIMLGILEAVESGRAYELTTTCRRPAPLPPDMPAPMYPEE